MSDMGEDHSNVGQTFAHVKADRVKNPTRGAEPSVPGRMVLAVLCGAIFGAMLSVIVAPAFLLAFVIGGAMTFAAGTVALILFKPAPPDEYASGFARTEEEVRETLADIEARKK